MPQHQLISGFMVGKIYLNPKIIVDFAKVWNHAKFKYKYVVYDGNWDEKKGSICNEFFYIGFKQVYIDKTHMWKDTDYVKKRKMSMSMINKWDRLYFNIKKNGWKEIGDYVSINIDRNGKILFNDGQHRLTFAKYLNLEKIPVKICVIHKKFYDENKDKLIEEIKLINNIS